VTRANSSENRLIDRSNAALRKVVLQKNSLAKPPPDSRPSSIVPLRVRFLSAANIDARSQHFRCKSLSSTQRRDISSTFGVNHLALVLPRDGAHALFR
jgi:hypothetical protein